MEIINQTNKKADEFKDTDLVCFCFKHTKKDIKNDFVKNKRSLIYENIVLEKKAGGCNCASENPKGK